MTLDRIAEDGGPRMLKLPVDVSGAAVGALRRQLSSAASGQAETILDGSQVGRVSGSGLAVLVVAARVLRGRGRVLGVRRPSTVLRQVLASAGLSHLLEPAAPSR